ncbi:hypothetical protein, partial [Ferruginibacter sp. HRS2-29]|uniref:hypothetical protein n=1 Tax=Ferruginibacter sp. HRS2-29 TaxID=2487334 RepID=UPI0020CED5A4
KGLAGRPRPGVARMRRHSLTACPACLRRGRGTELNFKKQTTHSCYTFFSKNLCNGFLVYFLLQFFFKKML